jgi:CBS domain containing-hemolysin-like protein
MICTEHLGFELEADGLDTIGGFVFNRLGYLPPSGTQVELAAFDDPRAATARKRIEEMLIEKTTWLPEDERTETRNGADEADGLVLIFGLGAVSFFFAGIEAGLLSVDP